MFWIDTDKALPAMNSQIVKFKVNLAGKYITKGHYDHNKQCWYTENGSYIKKSCCRCLRSIYNGVCLRNSRRYIQHKSRGGKRLGYG